LVRLSEEIRRASTYFILSKVSVYADLKKNKQYPENCSRKRLECAEFSTISSKRRMFIPLVFLPKLAALVFIAMGLNNHSPVQRSDFRFR
jgi:hypothetical protein